MPANGAPMFQAQLARLEPALVDLKPSMGATQSPIMGKLGELVDRVEATTHAAASAGRGVTSQVWRDFIQKNPGIEDPFIRVVQAAPEIADAATQGFLDNLLDTLEKSGLEDQVGKITSALDSYYQHRDAQGRPCDPSKGDRSCMLTKVAGGGMSVVKDVIGKSLAGAQGEHKQKLEAAIGKSIDNVLYGPRQLWDRLSDAWKAVILLAGLAAETKRVTGLTIGKGKLEFEVPPGMGPFTGKIEISEGKLKTLGASLPPIKLKHLTIKGSGSYEAGVSAGGSTAVVVPLKKGTAGVEISHDYSIPTGESSTTVNTSYTRPIGEKGKVSAGTSTKFDSGSSAIPTQYRVEVSSPVGKTKSMSVSAGVTGTVTKEGQRVELATNPAVTVGVSGQLPTLNRRLRKQEQGRYEEKQKVEEKKRREEQILIALQTEKDAKRKHELEQELIGLRGGASGSASRGEGEKSQNGDYIAAGIAAAMIAYAAVGR